MKKKNYAALFPLAVGLATSMSVAFRNVAIGIAIGAAFMAISFTFTRKQNSR